MKAAGMLFLLAGLTACAGPHRLAPADASVVPPLAWRGNEGTAQVVPEAWWRRFEDPALDKLVAQALAYNADLAIATARIEEAKAQLRLTDSRRLPSLGLDNEGGSSRSVNPFGLGIDQERAQIQMTSAYEVDLFGRLRQSTQAARADLLATEAARDAVRISLIATVVEGYIRLRALDSRLAIVDETVEARRRERDLIRRRYESGYASRLDDQQAAAAYEAAARLMPSTRLAISEQENALSVLAGHAPEGIARDTANLPNAAIAVPVSLPSQVLRQRPDIAEAENRIVAADHRLGAARAAFMPRLRLSASGGGVASTLLSSPITIFGLGGSLLAPLFEGGALHAQQDLATARRNEAAYAYRAAVLQAFREVEDAMASVALVSEESRTAERQVAASRSAFEAAKRRYDAGYSSYLEQLDSERVFLAARLDEDALRFQRLTAIVTLYRRLGGGWTGDVQSEANAQ